MSAGMRYLSVCSGIEAASVAWRPLGWSPVAFSEIEAFPSAVLRHHHPSVPNWGDMTRFQEWPDADVDVLVGGTPCQSFSVAGLRKGLDDPRGNLMLTFGAIAQRYRPRWVAWENVPGVLSSNAGRDFGTFLGMLAELGYGFAYRVLDAQYVRVDGYARAVPQRRRRVFVVGHLGDWRRAAAVLFERESLSGHPAPRREAGQGTTHDVAPCVGASGRGFERAGETRGQDPVVAHALACHMVKGGDPTTDNYVVGALQSGGTSRGHGTAGVNQQAVEAGHIIAIQDEATRGNPQSGPGGKGWRNDGASFTHLADHVQAVAFTSKDYGADVGENIAPTLRGMGHDGSHANGGGQVAVAFAHQQGGNIDLHTSPELGLTVQRNQTQVVMLPMAVRRLTPRECERLQGFPDDYTLVPYRGKDAADGPRYKALGNSMAVNCMRWIGTRLALVDEIATVQTEAA